MRYVNLKSNEPNPRVPYGLPKIPASAYSQGLSLRNAKGRETIWRITGEYGERRDRGVQPVQEDGYRLSRWIPNNDL